MLPTNNILHRWKIIDSPRCSFCFIAEETIHHLFCECHHTITLYLQIKELLDKCDINLPDINVNYILIGVPPISPNYSLINHILILYKHCVYVCRENELNLNLNYFLQIMKDTEKTERIIAKKENRDSKHLMKWEKVLGSISAKICTICVVMFKFLCVYVYFCTTCTVLVTYFIFKAIDRKKNLECLLIRISSF